MTTYTFNYSVLSVVDPAGPRDDTYASGINNLGQIVGTYLGSGPQRQGFVYNNGAYTTLDDPSATNGTFAQGINNLSLIHI